MTDSDATRPQLFFAYAQQDIDKWRAAIGEFVEHKRLGTGEIADVRLSNSKTVVVAIDFSEDDRKSRDLAAHAFTDRDVFLDMTLPQMSVSIDDLKTALTLEHDDERRKAEAKRQRLLEEKQEREARLEQLAAKSAERRAREERRRAEQAIIQALIDADKLAEHERKLAFEREVRTRQEQAHARQRAELEQQRAESEQQRAQEAQSRNEFKLLKQKYAAEKYTDDSPTSPLYPILLSFEEEGQLKRDQADWLLGEGLLGPLALNLIARFESTGDPWCLVNASRNWRDSGEPSRAIEATDRVKNLANLPPNLQAALLTTRGGAHRDLTQLAEAEKCARQAISIQPRAYYPYNLLGGIYYDLGEPAEGDKCFATAIILGASMDQQDRMKQGAIKNLTPEAQSETARYLLDQDPKRFAWAQYYLERPNT